MNLRVANGDIFLACRIRDEVHVVSHLRKRIRHLSDTRRRPVVGRKCTGGYHGDRITFRSVPPMWGRLPHVVTAGLSNGDYTLSAENLSLLPVPNLRILRSRSAPIISNMFLSISVIRGSPEPGDVRSEERRVGKECRSRW